MKDSNLFCPFKCLDKWSFKSQTVFRVRCYSQTKTSKWIIQIRTGRPCHIKTPVEWISEVSLSDSLFASTKIHRGGAMNRVGRKPSVVRLKVSSSRQFDRSLVYRRCISLPLERITISRLWQRNYDITATLFVKSSRPRTDATYPAHRSSRELSSLSFRVFSILSGFELSDFRRFRL